MKKLLKWKDIFFSNIIYIIMNKYNNKLKHKKKYGKNCVSDHG